MRRPRLPGRARPARAGRRVGAALALAGLLTALPATARADSPQQQAQRLAAQVQDLQRQAEAATEAYDAAQGTLAELVTASSLAEQQADQARAQDAAHAAGADSQIRELYMLGGPSVLYVGLLSAAGGQASPSAVQGRLLAARNILRADTRAALGAHALDAAAAGAADHARQVADRQLALEADLAARADQIRADLAQTQQLLDSADAQVRADEQLAEQQWAQAQQAAFLQAVARAQQAAAGPGGTVGGAVGGPAGTAGTPLPAAGTVGQAALAAAESLEGHPYQWGGTGPRAYDCSGMTGAAYAAVGIALPRTAAQQYLAGPHVPLDQLAPGDLLFWAQDPADPATIEHVAIYAGDGQMVSANHTGDVVRLQPVWWNGYAGATRPQARAAAGVGGPRWAPGQAA